MSARTIFVSLMTFMWLLTSCTGEEVIETAATTAVPTVADFFSVRSTSTPLPTLPPTPTLPPPVRDLSNVYVENYVIYDDDKKYNWEILDNPDAEIDIASTAEAHSGQRSIAFTPKEDFTTLFFAVRPNLEKSFPFDDTLGISFWLNGGDDYIEPDELAVTVIGSNDFTYWNPNDTSVEFPRGEYFSETRLYDLDISGSIPPDTWVQVYVWIDSLIYDPLYNYITGFYIKNDEGFHNTIYIDDVEVIMLAKPLGASTVQATAVSSPIPSGTLTAVPLDTPTVQSTVEVTTTIPITVSPTLELTTTPEGNSQVETSSCVVSPPPGWVQYTIQPNDAISNLAIQTGTAPETIISVNCLEENVILSIGERIWLPELLPTETPTVNPTPE